MKRLFLILPALLLGACESLPVNVAYNGAALGHNYSLAYSSGKGVAAVISAK